MQQRLGTVSMSQRMGKPVMKDSNDLARFPALMEQTDCFFEEMLETTRPLLGWMVSGLGLCVLVAWAYAIA